MRHPLLHNLGKGNGCMKTLYVSDLDGTLLHNDETTSEYTNNTVNTLVDKGILFSYATARSFHTAHKVTKGLNAQIPLIIYNGAMIIDNKDGRLLLNNFFGQEVNRVINDLFDNDIYPIVYSFISGKEKFSYVPARCTEGMNQFISSRKNDIREHQVKHENDIDMFEIADECYAVENAVDELKSIATGIIESNNDDGVAKWLNEHCL